MLGRARQGKGGPGGPGGPAARTRQLAAPAEAAPRGRGARAARRAAPRRRQLPVELRSFCELDGGLGDRAAGLLGGLQNLAAREAAQLQRRAQQGGQGLVRRGGRVQRLKLLLQPGQVLWEAGVGAAAEGQGRGGAAAAWAARGGAAARRQLGAAPSMPPACPSTPQHAPAQSNPTPLHPQPT